MISAQDFQSYAGPGDKNLPNTEIMGYQPVRVHCHFVFQSCRLMMLMLTLLLFNVHRSRELAKSS